jgi:hypothetical protein
MTCVTSRRFPLAGPMVEVVICRLRVKKSASHRSGRTVHKSTGMRQPFRRLSLFPMLMQYWFVFRGPRPPFLLWISRSDQAIMHERELCVKSGQGRESCGVIIRLN